MCIEKVSSELFERSTYEPWARHEIDAVLVERLLRLDPQQFLIHNFRLYSIGFCETLLLTFHELWQDFSTQDWKGLFRKNDDRPKPCAFDKSGLWCDCFFFSHWLNLNPFPLLLEMNSNIDGPTARVLDYFDINSPLIFADYNDDRMEYLDGKIFCEKNLILKTREKILRHDPSLEPSYKTPEELRDYIATIRKSQILGP